MSAPASTPHMAGGPPERGPPGPGLLQPGDAFVHDAGHGGLLGDDAGFAGSAFHAVDQGATAGGAALAYTALDGLLLARVAAIVAGLAVDKLADLYAVLAADLAALTEDMGAPYFAGSTAAAALAR